MERPDLQPRRRPRLLADWWEWVVASPLRAADEEARAYLASPASRAADRKVIAIFVAAALGLTANFYLSGGAGGQLLASTLSALGLKEAAGRILAAIHDPAHGPFWQMVIWCAARFVGYLLVPAVVVWLVLGERLRDYGLRLQGMGRGLGLYLILLALVTPLVLWASTFPSFLATYPFYLVPAGEPLWPRQWCWQAIYLSQFFVLEFFFRGFLLHGTRHRFGSYAVLVQTIPYCMIHFGKPLPETLGAIVAGLVLGLMSLKTRSIWLGAALHVAVAVMMDGLTLWRHGRLG